ncbi:aminotransferase class III-fold pyridoxal phosphate-dependent enzyme (plasmid) [Sinorhizobium meliloti]|nr:aminotransferase class III-fold pyridoxal phosphate-dependent enzyme [Sinorhizobium meliloti]
MAAAVASRSSGARPSSPITRGPSSWREEIVKAVPCADQVRFANSGTEGRLSRNARRPRIHRKTKILKFEGGYHGMSDYTLISLWSTSVGIQPSQPDSAGIPQSVSG